MVEDKIPFTTDTGVVSSELIEAAKMGFASAQWQVGNALYKASEYEQAFFWIAKAAHKGIVPAMNALGYMYLNGMGCPVLERRAFQWTAKAALEGDNNAEMNLGLMYFHGQGATKNDSAAFHWVRKAAEAGNRDAVRFMAFFYMNGIGSKPDEAAAFVWYQKAADDGDVHAMTKMAQCYETGIGIAKDPIKALDLYRRSSDRGDSEADVALGRIYTTGDEVIIPDSTKAHFYLKKAAVSGHTEARHLYGELLMQDGKDMIAAYFWLQLAANSGSKGALEDLKRFGPDYTWSLAQGHMRTVYGYVLGPSD